MVPNTSHLFTVPSSVFEIDNVNSLESWNLDFFFCLFIITFTVRKCANYR